jgi:hypothetical protein
MQDDITIKRIARHHRPMMEHLLTEGLSLGVRAQICFEAKATREGERSVRRGRRLTGAYLSMRGMKALIV